GSGAAGVVDPEAVEEHVGLVEIAHAQIVGIGGLVWLLTQIARANECRRRLSRVAKTAAGLSIAERVRTAMREREHVTTWRADDDAKAIHEHRVDVGTLIAKNIRATKAERTHFAS